MSKLPAHRGRFPLGVGNGIALALTVMFIGLRFQARAIERRYRALTSGP
jgi:hypothetical protein